MKQSKWFCIFTMINIVFYKKGLLLSGIINSFKTGNKYIGKNEVRLLLWIKILLKFKTYNHIKQSKLISL